MMNLRTKLSWWLMLCVLAFVFNSTACRPTEPGKEGNTQTDGGEKTSPDGGDVKTDKPIVKTELTIKDIQDSTSKDHPIKGAALELKNVVIVSPVFVASSSTGLKGFFVSDKAFPGKFGGVMVVVESEFDDASIKVGDVVNIVGIMDEYYNNTQIVARKDKGGSITKVGDNVKEEIKAAELDAKNFKSKPDGDPNSAAFEPYEGVLVEFKNVKVTKAADNFGAWEIEGGVVVDDSFFKGFKPKVGDTLAHVRGIVYYSYELFRVIPRSSADIDGAKAECTKDDECGIGRKCNVAGERCETITCAEDGDCKSGEVCNKDAKRCTTPLKEINISDVQDKSSKNYVSKGGRVELKGVIVSSPMFVASSSTGLQGFFITDPSNTGKYTGVMVIVDKDAEKLELGDVIDIKGRVDEYYSNTQINARASQQGEIKKTGKNSKEQIKFSAVPAEDMKAEPADKNDPDSSKAEPWEGVLIELKDLVVAEDTNEKYGETKLEGGLLIDDTIFKGFKAKKGDKIKVLRGVVQYSFNKYRILPRQESDIQQ